MYLQSTPLQKSSSALSRKCALTGEPLPKAAVHAEVQSTLGCLWHQQVSVIVWSRE